MRPNGSRLSCGASAGGRKRSVLRYELVGAQIDDLPLRAGPDSFKRLLGRAFRQPKLPRSVKHGYDANTVRVDAIDDSVRPYQNFAEVLIPDLGHDAPRAGPSHEPLGSRYKTIDCELRVVLGVASDVGTNRGEVVVGQS